MDHLLELTERAQASHFWFRGFRAFMNPVLAGITGGRGDLRLLDCGCGRGHNLALLRPYGRVFGFDIAEASLKVVRQSGWPLVRADVGKLPYLPNSFDVVTSFDVLPMVSDDRQAVRQMAHALKPGGTMLLTVAAFEMLRGDHAEIWREFRRYTPRMARALVEEAGLRVTRLSFLFASLFPLMCAVRITQRVLRPYRSPRIDADIRVPTPPINAALTLLLLGEAALARHVPMPIGSSILIVARKP
jgi:SAM-dependent methyltransferase